MARWKHGWETRGGISFANGKQVEIVDGEFDAPDDPALEARFIELGHVRVETPPPAEPREDEGEGGEPAEAPAPKPPQTPKQAKAPKKGKDKRKAPPAKPREDEGEGGEPAEAQTEP